MELHSTLCHPGVARMAHFVCERNLPFSVEDVRRVTSACPICAECKLQFAKPAQSQLIKATQPFERLNIDSKAPLPSASQNRYMLTVTIVNEYPRFPFIFPCSDVMSATVMNCLCRLFTIFGMLAYIHSDRGSSFVSTELRSFLSSKEITSS